MFFLTQVSGCHFETHVHTKSTLHFSKNIFQKLFFPQGTGKGYFKVKIHSTIFLVMPNSLNYFQSSNKKFVKETKGPYKMAYNNISVEFETIRQNKGSPREKKASWLLD